MAAKDKKNGVTIVIKKEEVVEGGHHGGAWKVAYADFVTAMMAFFLLMWLLNATTEAQRKGLADYFTPMNALSRASSGTGQPFGGHTPYDEGSLVSDKGSVEAMQGKAPPADEQTDGDQSSPAQTTPPTAGHAAAAGRAGQQRTAHGNAATEANQDGEQAPGGGVAPAQARTPSRAEFLASAGAGTQKPDIKQIDDAALRAETERRERAEFEKAAQQIRDAVHADPTLADLSRQLAIDITPEGLRIQLLDEDNQPMFPSGSAALSDKAKLLLQKVAPVLAKLSESLVLTGHTDATPYSGPGRTNWELSADRANSTRRVLVEAGLPEERFREVSGRADRDPLLPADPTAAANRRIAIVVQHSYHPS